MKKLITVFALFTMTLTTAQEYRDLGVMGVTYSSKGDLGIALEFDGEYGLICGAFMSMNLESYRGIGKELEYARVSNKYKLSNESEYKKMSIGVLVGGKINRRLSIVSGLGYTHKVEYYRLDTGNLLSDVSYNYHVETGNFKGALHFELKARIHLAESVAFSIGAGTDGANFGLYYVINSK